MDQPEANVVHAQFDRVLDALTDKLPAVAAHLVSCVVSIAAALEPPTDTLGATHCSSRLLGEDPGVGDATVARGLA